MEMMFPSFIAIALSLLVSVCNGQINIQTSSGNVKGKIVTVEGNKYATFQGIPYVKAPTGNLRFQPPQQFDTSKAADSIDGTIGYSKTCIQPFYIPTTQSEDCLYLNVFTPKTQTDQTTKYPVMVWIHGGAFILGSADLNVDGVLRNLVSRGVVLVSLNYRLGAFGFFSTKSTAAAGNYGFLDQVEALKWVQKNIPFFGGDPTKVTIFGESAGGASVSYLTLSPMTKGLFSQAIMQSSPYYLFAFMFDEDERSATLSTSLGCRTASTPTKTPSCPYGFTGTSSDATLVSQHKEEVQCLQKKSTADVAAALQKIPSKGWGGRIDGVYFPESLEELAKKRPAYPMMIGTNRDETAIFSLTSMPNAQPPTVVTTKKEFMENTDYTTYVPICANFKYPDLVNFASRFYYSSQPASFNSKWDEDHFWFQQSVKIRSGLEFWIQAYIDAANAAATKSTVYLYSFDWADAAEYYSTGKDFYYKGAPHGSELKFLFDDKTSNPMTVTVDPLKSRRDRTHDSDMTQLLGKMWTNFAKFGNPTSGLAPTSCNKWDSLKANEMNYLSINLPNCKMQSQFYNDDVRLWKDLILPMPQYVKCPAN